MIAYWAPFLLTALTCVALNVHVMERKLPRSGLVSLICMPFLISLTLFAGLRSQTSDVDYLNYVDWFATMSPSATLMDTLGKDPVFQILGLALKGDQGSLVALMLAIAFLSLLIKIHILRREYFSHLLGFGLLFLMARFFTTHEFTQVRAALGISLATLGLIYSAERRNVLAVVFFSLGALTHLSVVVLAPLLLLNDTVRLRFKVLAVLGACLMIWVAGPQLVEQFGLVARVLPYFTGEYEVSANSLVSVYFLTRVSVTGFMLMQWRTLNPGLRLAALASCYGILLTVAFVRMDVFSLRLSELVSIFDCICIAYVFAVWYDRQRVLATAGALGLSAIFYLSGMNIVNEYALAG